MSNKTFINIILILNVFILFAYGIAGANPIVVSTIGEDIVVRQNGEFELLIDRSHGGTIAKYFDLKTDPTKTTNIVVNKSQGSIYHGLHFIMFKQGGGNLPVPERWTAQWETRADMEVIYQSSKKVLVHVSGDFHGHLHLPASYDMVYTIESDPDTSGALIYIRSRIIFNSNYSNTMQIRQAFGLTGRYGTAGGWVEYSQNGGLSPWWTHRPGDDYIGARLNAARLKTDPFVTLHRDWKIATYILLIAPPKVNHYCLLAWVSNRPHNYTAGHVIENKYLVRMDQMNVTDNNSVASLAAAYRKTDGGDFEGKADVHVNSFLHLLLTDEVEVEEEPDAQANSFLHLLLNGE